MVDNYKNHFQKKCKIYYFYHHDIYGTVILDSFCKNEMLFTNITNDLDHCLKNYQKSDIMKKRIIVKNNL